MVAGVRVQVCGCRCEGAGVWVYVGMKMQVRECRCVGGKECGRNGNPEHASDLLCSFASKRSMGQNIMPD